MKFSFAWAATAVMLALLAWALPASAQGPGATRPVAPVAPRAPGTSVAVIDISQVFEKHARFQDQMKALKAEVEDFEKTLRDEQGKMTKLRDELQSYAPGSPQFKAKEEEMAKLNGDVNVKMALQRKEFLEKEAKVYYATYSEVYAVIGDFADRNGIGLVLRFNSEDMKPEDRASVLQGVNRAVVFQRNLNITNLIIKICNNGAPEPQSPGKTGSNGREEQARRPGTPGLK